MGVIIFDEVQAKVSPAFAQQVADVDQQDNFFMNIGKEADIKCTFTNNSWFVSGELENVNKAYKLLSTIYSLVGSDDKNNLQDLPRTVPNSEPNVEPHERETSVDDESDKSDAHPVQESVHETEALPRFKLVRVSKLYSSETHIKKKLVRKRTQGSKKRLFKHFKIVPSYKESKLQSQILPVKSSGFLDEFCLTNSKETSENETNTITLESAERDSTSEDTEEAKCESVSTNYNVADHELKSADACPDPSIACPKCDKVFSRVGNMNRHLRVAHKGLRFPCKECDKAFTCQDTLDKHAMIVHKNLRCTKCRLVFKTEDDLAKHICGRKASSVQCTECGKWYSKLANLNKHYRLEHKHLRFPCSVCNREYKSKDHLNWHYRKKHSIYKCTKCDLSFDEEDEHESHVYSVHGINVNKDKRSNELRSNVSSGNANTSDPNSEKKSLICPYCQKEFSRISNMNKHIRILHENVRLRCEQCGKGFKQRGQLVRHTKSVHEGLSFECATCCVKFTTRKLLAKHQMLVHKQLSIDGVVQCEQCGKSFLYESNLWHHIKRIHEGLTYACDKCNKKFSTRQKMKEHVQVEHEGVRFTCEQCPKIFRRKEKMKEHFVSCHTNKKPLTCDECGERFSRWSTLSYHTRKVHKQLGPRRSRRQAKQKRGANNIVTTESSKDASTFATVNIPTVSQTNFIQECPAANSQSRQRSTQVEAPPNVDSLLANNNEGMEVRSDILPLETAQSCSSSSMAECSDINIDIVEICPFELNCQVSDMIAKAVTSSTNVDKLYNSFSKPPLLHHPMVTQPLPPHQVVQHGAFNTPFNTCTNAMPAYPSQQGLAVPPPVQHQFNQIPTPVEPPGQPLTQFVPYLYPDGYAYYPRQSMPQSFPPLTGQAPPPLTSLHHFDKYLT